MAGRTGGIAGIVVGVLLGVLTLPAGGAGFWAWAAWTVAVGATIAAGAVSLAFQPRATNREQTRSADLQVATAAEGVPLPVIFGEQRVVSNFMNYTADNFRSVKVLARSDGSKGGDPGQPAQVVGFDYFLTYELGLCMGPIDEVVQVFGAPGERKMMGEDPTVQVFEADWDSAVDGDNYKEINLDSLDPTSSAGAESGLVRLYRGSKNQSRIVSSDPYHFGSILTTGHIKAGYRYRIETSNGAVNFVSFGAASNTVGIEFLATASSGSVLSALNSVTEYTGLNYRHICWALHMDFLIGRFPQPKSYHYILRRFPAHDSDYHMLRPDGTAISGFKVRGSGDSGHAAYYQANPAAVIYECLTNEVWGRGLSQDIFNEDSFVSVSAYFFGRNIGMSFTIDSQDKVTNVIDGIKAQLKVILTPDGEQLKLRCLLDLATTHGAIQTVTKAEVRELRCIRALWASTTNEIRAEFVNRTKNFRPDSIHVRDLANRQITGRVNSERIQLSGLIDFNITRKQAFRILRERSYPLAVFEFEINRFKSQLEVGDVFKLWWNEYGGETTIYCMVGKIEDSDSDADAIKISAIEDNVLMPASGSEATPSIPSQAAWEFLPDLDEFDVGLWDGEAATIPNDDKPAAVLELPPVAGYRIYGDSRNEGAVLLLGQKPSALYNAINVFVSTASQTTARLLSHIPSVFAISGTLSSDLRDLDPVNRSTSGFTFSLFDSNLDEAQLLSTFSTISLAAHSIEDLLTLTGAFAFIGNEILQIGLVEKIGTNSYRATNFVRGRFGSNVKIRESGDRIFFTTQLPTVIPLFADAGNTLSGNGVSNPVRFQAVALANNPANNLPYEDNDFFYLPHDGTAFTGTDRDTRYWRESDLPLKPSHYSMVDNGTDYTVKVRPRFRNLGAGTTGNFYQEFTHIVTTLGTVSYQITASNPAETRVLNIAYTFEPGELDDDSKGLVTFTFPKQFHINNLGVATTGPGGAGLTTYDVERVELRTFSGGREALERWTWIAV